MVILLVAPPADDGRLAPEWTDASAEDVDPDLSITGDVSPWPLIRLSRRSMADGGDTGVPSALTSAVVIFCAAARASTAATAAAALALVAAVALCK